LHFVSNNASFHYTELREELTEVCQNIRATLRGAPVPSLLLDNSLPSELPAALLQAGATLQPEPAAMACVLVS